jgi:hypothetical protein
MRNVVACGEREGNQLLPQHLDNDRGIAEVKSRLGKNGFARQQWCLDVIRNSDRPIVILVSFGRESDEESGIRNAVHDLEKPLRFERSRDPLMIPASFINGFDEDELAFAFSSCSRISRPCDTPVVSAVCSSHSARSFVSRTVIV